MKDLVFVVDKKHAAQAYKWYKEHPCKFRKKPPRVAIAEGISFSFTAASIGQIQNVRCSCGASMCINADEL